MRFRHWLEKLLQSLGLMRVDVASRSDSGQASHDVDFIALPARSQAERQEEARQIRQRVSQQILTGWQRGEWSQMQTVAALHPEEVRSDPVASALMALACLQSDDEPASRTWLRFCLDAGADPVWLTRLLLGGAESSLANACALMGKADEAQLHQQSALTIQTACIEQAGSDQAAPRSLFNMTGMPVSHVVNGAAS